MLVVDHFGKNIEVGTKGSSNKEDASDLVLAMLADRDVGGSISNTRMKVRKLRNGKSGVEFPFNLVQRFDGLKIISAASASLYDQVWMTGWRFTSSMPAMMRSLSSCFEVTRMWRKTERANLEKKPSMRLSHEPCLGVKVNSNVQAVERRARLLFLSICAQNDYRGSA